MPLSVDIFNKKILSDQSRFGKYNILLSGEAVNVDLSNYYTRDNPSGFITGVDLSPYITTGQTGAFYAASNPSGYITTTNVVFTTGDQTISGIKNFVDNIYIKNLFVTGTETIVSTTNFNVQSPYLILNLTGGAVDGGIFFVTGSGFSGINDYGPIIGFDHSKNFKFGIARRSDDLSTLNDIAAIQDVTNYSGFVDNKYSTILNLESTGSNLQNQINNLNNSGFITGIENLVYTIGDQAVSGIKTFLSTVYANQIKGRPDGFFGNQLNLFGGDGGGFGGPVVIQGGTGANANGNIQLQSSISINRGTNKDLSVLFYKSGDVGTPVISVNDSDLNIQNGLSLKISGITIDPTTYVNTTGNQTIGGLKTFSSGIIITGGTINLAGKDVVGITDAFGESVIIRGGSGVGDGSAFSFANGGNITLIGGNALSGGFPPVTPGNITIIGGSGGNLPTFAPLPETIGSINLYGGARTSDNRGGPIIAHGNIYINPDPIKSREFIIYKSGNGALGAADNLVVRQNSVNVNNLLTVSGNPVLTGINIDLSNYYTKDNPSGFITGVDLSNYTTGSVVRPSETGNFITSNQTGAFYTNNNPSGFITGIDLSNYATTGQLNQVNVNLQNQINNLGVNNSIAFAIALG
jgi:hypothetical protein